jgi:hypothetical protein
MAGATVNGSELLSSPFFTITTCRAPGVVVRGMVKVALICVAEITWTFEVKTVAPSPARTTMVPGVKLVPVSVTFTELPCLPELGDTLVSVGGLADLTKNCMVLLDKSEPGFKVISRAPNEAVGET